ncbi:hypothetical protein NL676_012237 [Syzygium grande]|nr:hypothetical protein NL676_012237 [Syzygium grande]
MSSPVPPKAPLAVPFARFSASHPSRPRPTIIKTFLTIVYSIVKGHKIGEASLIPTVRLNDFEDEDPTYDDELEELKRESIGKARWGFTHLDL